MADLHLSTLSLDYVHVPVVDRLAAADPTTDTVQMAFVAGGNPTTGDWKTASWYTDSVGTPPVYYARCLVGPTGTAATVTLAAGSYDIWVKLTDNPEVPVLKATGKLVVE